MIGLDTNLIVRFLTNDDKTQARFAAKLIGAHPVFLPKSVLLETEWVLRYTYGLSPAAIRKAFESLLGLPHVTVEDPTCIIKTLQWYREGLDFADALHLASSQQVNKFATFDRSFAKKAKKLQFDMVTM